MQGCSINSISTGNGEGYRMGDVDCSGRGFKSVSPEIPGVVRLVNSGFATLLGIGPRP